MIILYVFITILPLLLAWLSFWLFFRWLLPQLCENIYFAFSIIPPKTRFENFILKLATKYLEFTKKLKDDS
jgi:hypothetical protein